MSLKRCAAVVFTLACALWAAMAGAEPMLIDSFEDGKVDPWVASAAATVKLRTEPAAGPTGTALRAETTNDRMYLGRPLDFVEADSCLSVDLCSAGPAPGYFTQLAVKTADGKEHWASLTLQPTMGQWVHSEAPLTRTFSQALRGARLTWVWVGQVRAQGAEGRGHSLLIDNLQVRHHVPPVTERDLFVTATRLTRAPLIDGQLDDPAWQGVAPLGSFVKFDGTPVSARTEVLVGHDAERLYVALRSADRSAELVARETKPDGPVWADDSFELFLDPDRDRSTYYQLATNPLGTRYSQRGVRNKDGSSKLDVSWEPDWQVAARRTAEGWTAEMGIRFADLGMGPGGAWGLQIGRSRPKGETCSLFLREKDWCDPSEWGLLVFGERPPGLRVTGVGERRLTAELAGEGEALVRTESLLRSGAAVRTEGRFSPPGVVLPYRVHESGKQRLAVTLLQPADRPVCRFSYPLGDTRDRQVLRPQTLATSEQLGLWALAPTWKVRHEDRVEDSAPNPVVELQAGRNQVRALQIGVTPRRPPLRQLRLELADLTSARARIAREQLSYNVVGYVTIKTPSDFTTFPGDWPDPLLPPTAVDAADSGHLVFWVTVRVPRDVPPGVYEGPVRLVGEGVAQEFILRVKVLGYELPDRSKLMVEADVWNGWGIYRTVYGGISQDDYTRNVVAHRASGTGRFRAGTQEETIASGKAYFASGLDFAWFPVQFIGAGGWDGRRKWGKLDIDPDDPAFAAAFTEELRRLAAVFREQGWLAKTALWIWDEPFWEQDARLRDKLPKLCKLARQAAADLPIFLSNSPLPQLEGLVDIWCPALDFSAPDLSPMAVAARHAKGDRIFVYHNSLMLIDLPAVNARVLPWIARKHSVDGIVLWAINYWGGTGGVATLDPWTEGLDGVARRHGDGWLVYPTKTRDGLLNSLRWELFREGLNDYDTLSLLQQRLAEVRRRGNAADRGWIAEAAAVLTEADGVVPGYRDVSVEAPRLEDIMRRAETALDRAP